MWGEAVSDDVPARSEAPSISSWENSIPRTVIWIGASACAAVALARISVWIQEYGFPSLIPPVLFGGLVAAATVCLSRVNTHSNARLLLTAAVVLALLAVLAEHLFFYLDYRAQFAASAAKDPSVELFRAAGGLEPASFSEFLDVGSKRPFGLLPSWAWWMIDAGLTMVASAIVVLLLRGGSPGNLHAQPRSD